MLDVMMPGEDGLSILRTLDPVDRPAVILLSAIGEDVDRAIDVQMSRLRKKMARPGADELIRTIRNEGYLFNAEVGGR
ncbi:winged helix-turn-helix domain-containing protein [Sphingomonas sp.]|uniref:winged helix-turn-helix domain-containing protein n=1 Tax=Sphingomonas sp. TaxID=28214 RepID=UPI002EDB2900